MTKTLLSLAALLMIPASGMAQFSWVGIDLVDPQPTIAGFGTAVAIAGDHAFVSSDGRVYVYRRNEGGVNGWGWVQTLTAPDGHAAGFGRALLARPTGLVIAREYHATNYAGFYRMETLFFYELTQNNDWQLYQTVGGNIVQPHLSPGGNPTPHIFSLAGDDDLVVLEIYRSTSAPVPLPNTQQKLYSRSETGWALIYESEATYWWSGEPMWVIPSDAGGALLAITGQLYTVDGVLVETIDPLPWGGGISLHHDTLAVVQYSMITFYDLTTTGFPVIEQLDAPWVIPDTAYSSRSGWRVRYNEGGMLVMLKERWSGMTRLFHYEKLGSAEQWSLSPAVDDLLPVTGYAYTLTGVLGLSSATTMDLSDLGDFIVGLQRSDTTIAGAPYRVRLYFKFGSVGLEEVHQTTSITGSVTNGWLVLTPWRGDGERCSYSIYDSGGKVVDEGNYVDGGGAPRISVAHLAPGVHILVVRSDHLVTRLQFIK